jgi:hypothetical protein
MNTLQPSLTASTIVAQEGATVNKVIEMILKGDDPLEIIKVAREVEDKDLIVPELQHLRGFTAGLQEHWVEQHKGQIIQELRWELGYTIMQMAYGEQPFNITPLERVK